MANALEPSSRFGGYAQEYPNDLPIAFIHKGYALFGGDALTKSKIWEAVNNTILQIVYHRPGAINAIAVSIHN